MRGLERVIRELVRPVGTVEGGGYWGELGDLVLLETNCKRHQAGNGWMDCGLFALVLVEEGGNFSG